MYDGTNGLTKSNVLGKFDFVYEFRDEKGAHQFASFMKGKHSNVNILIIQTGIKLYHATVREKYMKQKKDSIPLYSNDNLIAQFLESAPGKEIKSAIEFDSVMKELDFSDNKQTSFLFNFFSGEVQLPHQHEASTKIQTTETLGFRAGRKGFKKLSKVLRKISRKANRRSSFFMRSGLSKSEFQKVAKRARINKRRGNGVHCATKCMHKVKKYPVKVCTKLFKKGRKHRRCQWSKVKDICSRKCKFGAKRCWRVCSKKSCYGKQVTVCKRKCHRHKHCYRECKYRKVKNCFYDRIPGNWIHKCKKVWKSKGYRKCLRSCTHYTTKCSDYCSHVKVSRKYRKCQLYMVRGATVKKRCSYGKYHHKCSKLCSLKKMCGTVCKKKLCNGRYVKQCKYKCWRGSKCVRRCTKNRQVKCYMRRVPAKYANRCWNMLQKKTVKRCFKKCFRVVKHISMNKIQKK
eukprot:gene12396-6063_t